MANAKTGALSAFGAILGGVLGAAAGKYAQEFRPRHRGRGRPGYTEIEDSMVIGGAAGSVLGAFIAGTAGAEESPQVVAAVAAHPAVQPQLRFP
jgi:MFS family permease